MTKTMGLLALVVFCACSLVIAGCGDDDEGTTTPAPDASNNAQDTGNNPTNNSTNNPTNNDLPDAADEGSLPTDTDQPDVERDTSEPDTPVDDDVAQDVSPDLPTGTACTLGGGECGASEHCVPAGLEETLICVPTGTLAPGSDCDPLADDCGGGSVCIPFDDENAACQVVCDDGFACAETYQHCLPWFGMSGEEAGICYGDPCTPPATGCDADERCSYLNGPDGAFAACLPAGDVVIGGDCTDDACQAGAVCVPGSPSTCRIMCQAGSDCSGDGMLCAFSWDGIEEYGICTDGCDPAAQTGCDDGESCYYSDPDEGSTTCFTTGSYVEGEDCSDISGFCGTGLDCVLQPGSDPFEYYCRAYCDAANPCASGTCITTPATQALKFCMP